MSEEDQNEKKGKELKLLSLANNIHNLTPMPKISQEGESVAIIKALRSDELISSVILQLEGYRYSPREKAYVVFRKAVMNNAGIGNFASTLDIISKTIEFSNFKEKEIPKYALYFFKINYPYFTIHYDDYDLAMSDFNLISTILMGFILSSFKKAQGAGHRNVVRGVYSEDILGKFGGNYDHDKEKNKFKLGNLNPFKRRDL